MRLDGMKEICNYMRRSEDTVLRMVRFQDMPAAKLGGIWVSDTESIDKWVKSVIDGNGNAAKHPENRNVREKPAKHKPYGRF